jgi:hypothetical protein
MYFFLEKEKEKKVKEIELEKKNQHKNSSSKLLKQHVDPSNSPDLTQSENRLDVVQNPISQHAVPDDVSDEIKSEDSNFSKSLTPFSSIFSSPTPGLIDKNKPSLQKITFEITKGSLTMIIGFFENGVFSFII